jgi:RND superfamily putative drug exporter
MLGRLARLTTTHRKSVLLGTLVIVLAAGAYGSSAIVHLSSGGFTDATSPSTKADALLTRQFHQGDPNIVFLLQAAAGINSPAARSVGLTLWRDLSRQPNVANVASYWTVPPAIRAGFASTDGHAALVTALVEGNDNVAPKRGEALADRYDGMRDGVRVRAGGLTVIDYQMDQQISRDLSIAEAVAVPLTLIALVVVFGSVIAALLPLAVGGVAIIGTLAVLRLLTLFVPVSVYALNLTTALGLGLAVDYSLFILSRYREELRKGLDVPTSVITAVGSAGRTVLFSSLTVGLSLAAMLVFPFYFLRSFAYAGLAVVAVAAAGAVIVLPALLRLLGTRVNAWDVRPALRRLTRGRLAASRPPARHGNEPVGTEMDGDEVGFWCRLTLAVMRRPAAFGLAVLAVLVLLGSPFFSVRFGLPDDRVLPASASSRQVADMLRSGFRQDNSDALTVVLPDLGSASPRQLSAYAARLSLVPGVDGVISPEGTYVAGDRHAPLSTPAGAGTFFTVENNVVPYSSQGRRLVSALRHVRAPVPALVTGLAARSVDSLNALVGMLPFALGLIALSTLVVLFAFSRSVLIPFKALALNTLPLSATFGAMVWVFQDGHLSGLLGGVGATGYLDPAMLVLMFCIAFGLSMDYEVFLLSRIKEEWDGSEQTANANTVAVARGLERTGPIVTAAAALISIVFIAVATSQVSFIKMFGTGMALAVLMDATLVRGVLVPAFMRLAGRANWWSPRWLAAPSRGGHGGSGGRELELRVHQPGYEFPPA